jgi:O-antigen ligase
MPRLARGGEAWWVAGRGAFAAAWSLVGLNIPLAPALFTQPLLFTIVVGGRDYPIGVIVLIPLVATLATSVGWWRTPAARPRRWGPPLITVPVAALGFLAIVRSWPVHASSVLVTTLVGVALFWYCYAYTLHAWPPGWAVVTTGSVAALHGTVALAQFVVQRSVGLAFLGELALDPQIRGISVIEVAGQRWLRAYGLLPHPNVLGGLAGLALLVCLGVQFQAPGRRPWLWGCACAAGVGLLVSFSRSAWLGTALGLAYLAFVSRLWRRVRWSERRTRAVVLGMLAMAVTVGIAFGGLVGARFGRIDSLLEHNSVAERVRDIGQAWMLIRHLPFRGVGTGYYVDALWAWAHATGRTFPAFQEVHNVPLLLSAEMGVMGGLLWLWLVIYPPISLARTARRRPAPPALAGWGAGFVLILVVGMLDMYPYFLNFRSGALLGVLCGVFAKEAGAADGV